jgi:hypothetical protein
LKLKKNIIYEISLFLFLFLSIFPSKIFLLGIVSYYISFLYISLKNIDISIKFIAFTVAFSGIIRLNEFRNPLLAGFGTIQILLLFLAYLLYIFKNKIEINLYFQKKLIFFIGLLCSFLTVIILKVFIDDTNIEKFLFIAREYFIPFLLLPIVIYALQKNIYLIKSIALYFFIGTSIIALLNIYHYFFGINGLEISRMVMYFDSSNFYQRTIAGISIPRMQHILGLSSAGAGAAFYVTAAYIGYYCTKNKKNMIVKTIFILLIIILIIASILTVSFTGMVTVLFISFIIFLFSRSKLKFLLLFIFIFLLFLILFTPIISTGGLNSKTLFDYILFMLDRIVSMTNMLNIKELLFGNGMGLKSGIALGIGDMAGTLKASFFSDKWIFIVFFQLGLIGLVLSVLLTVLPIIYLYRLRKKLSKNNYIYIIIPLLFLVGSMSFVHGYMLIERLFSRLVVFSFAMIYVLYKQNGVKY